MKTVSDDYILHIGDIIRNESHVRIIIVDGEDTYTFEGDQILSVSQTDNVDPLSRKLPVETVKFEISDLDGLYNPYSPSGVWEMLDLDSEVTIETGYTVNGVIEWLEPDIYLLDGKPTSENGVASFTASRRLAHLTETYYKGRIEFLPYITFDYEARRILTDAGLTSDEYELDEVLDSKVSLAAPPIATHAECLQLIAHACGCTLYTKPDGKIAIKAFAIPTVSNGFSLTRQSIKRKNETTSKTPPLKAVSTKRYRYNYILTSETIAEFVITTSGDYHVEYDLTYNPSISTDTGTLSNVEMYGRAADFTLTTAGTAVVTISGNKVYINNETLTENVSIIGETDAEDNEMIAGDFAFLRTLYADYLSRRLTHTISYRGNPELQCGDCIYYETAFGGLALALVLSTHIDYSGGITGELILKNLSEIAATELYDSDVVLVKDKNDEQVTLTDSNYHISDFTIDDMNNFIEEVL